MSNTDTERFPFAPLEDLARYGNPPHINQRGRGCPHCTRLGTTDTRVSATCVTDHQVAERLGVAERQVYRYRHTGLTTEAADRLAVRLGRHPAELWPTQWMQIEWTDEEPADELEVAA